MEKILIVGCKNAMDDICIGCSRCMVAFNRRQGVFEIYEDTDAEIMGIVGCGGCPASAIVTRLMQAKLWNAPMNEKPTVIHIAPCIAEQCPNKEEIIKKIITKAGIKVRERILMPPRIFSPEQKNLERLTGLREVSSCGEASGRKDQTRRAEAFRQCGFYFFQVPFQLLMQ